MTTKLSPGARMLVLVGGTAVVGGLFFVYEQLRRARRGDFPFLFEPLFLHGLLLIAIGVIAVMLVKVALGGGRATAVIASLLVGLPSLALAAAPYLIGGLELNVVPDRLLGDGFHQMGMLGIGAALGILVIGLASPARAEEDTANDEA